MIDETKLREYDPSEDELSLPNIDNEISKLVQMIKESKRPLFVAGHGIRLSGALKEFEELVAKVCAVRGENDRGVQNGYGILTSIYQNRLNFLSPFFHCYDSTSQK